MTETWPTPSGITEAQANQICRDAATGANAHGLCHNLFGDDIYIGVAPCVDDIMVQYRTGCLILHLNGFVLHIVATKHSHVMTMHTAQHLLSTSLREKILGDTFEFKIQMLIPSDFFENKNMFFIWRHSMRKIKIPQNFKGCHVSCVMISRSQMTFKSQFRKLCHCCKSPVKPWSSLLRPTPRTKAPQTTPSWYWRTSRSWCARESAAVMGCARMESASVMQVGLYNATALFVLHYPRLVVFVTIDVIVEIAVIFTSQPGVHRSRL